MNQVTAQAVRDSIVNYNTGFHSGFPLGIICGVLLTLLVVFGIIVLVKMER